jgi:hypothetical protein
MFLARNESGLYLRGIKRGCLMYTPRALDAMEFVGMDDLRQFLDAFAPTVATTEFSLV